MSRDASITLTWGDGDHTFRLAWGQLAKLQEDCDAGPYVVLRRLSEGEWKMQDISQVIRWGLIGGGKTPVEALKLVRTYVEDRPPLENLLIAQAILTAGVMGAPDEDSVKKNASPTKGKGSTLSPTESSGSQKSTELVQ